jgi:DNA invertase Pin-like site-specific DNA recombinase
MRGALYLRVSTKTAKNGREQTPENQRRKLNQFAESMDWEIVAEFEDRESGTKSDRPQFKAMMEAAARRDFDVVLVYAMDRFSREGVGKTCEYLRRLASYKVGFRSYSEPFLDTTGDFAELVTAIFAFFASFERRRIVERVNAGLERARAEGKSLGRPRKIFRRDEVLGLHRDGLSHRAIADRLGISKGTVQNVLTGK